MTSPAPARREQPRLKLISGEAALDGVWASDYWDASRLGVPARSAEWVKHNLNRIRDTLPNGYCGRPAQQDCPHPNACLTCPDFQTTPVFLEIHRRQAATNRTLIAQADGNGQQRLAENLRRVQANLERIIPALETLESEDPGDGTR